MKKLIHNKLLEYKFKKAGEGHRLNEEKAPPSLPQTQQAPRQPPSSSAQAAGNAALVRFEQKDQKQSSRPKSSRALEPLPALSRQGSGSGNVEKKACAQPLHSGTGHRSAEVQEPVMEVLDTVSQSTAVHLICPICELSIGGHSSVHSHFTDCLQEEYLKEPLSASVHMIHSLCKNQERRQLCIDTICKYLDNILLHPGEEKYTKIPMNNKAFKDKVQCVQGATLFLEAVGFQQRLLPRKDTEEQFYVLPVDRAMNADHLQAHKELLLSAQPLNTNLKVDRNIQVFMPSPRATHFDLPRDFFNLTLEEIKKEQKQRSEVAEHEVVLRTKVMRDRDNARMILRHYTFALVRIRLPDGFVLQGVFRPTERIIDVRSFICEVLVHQTYTFSLSALGKPITDEEGTLASTGLVPSALLNLTWTASVPPSPPFITADLLARIQELR